jgi:hypothetical protein
MKGSLDLAVTNIASAAEQQSAEGWPLPLVAYLPPAAIDPKQKLGIECEGRQCRDSRHGQREVRKSSLVFGVIS